MPSASYYRNQAILLLEWANETQDPAAANRLRKRAQEMLALAENPDRSTFDAIDHFNK